jgi:murein hydrolase activator
MLVSRPDRFAILWLGLIAVAAPAVAADNPQDKLRVILKNQEQSREERDSLAKEAESLGADIDQLRRDSIAAAQIAQEHEAALSTLETQLESLGADEARKTEELHARQKQQAGLLMALVQLARNPPEALALSSPDPVAAERSAMLMGQTLPPLARAARELSDNLKELAALRIAIGQAQEEHRGEQRSLDQERKRLADLIARKTELQQRASHGADETGQRIAELGREAADLKDLIDRLEHDRQQREADAARRDAARKEAAKLAAAAIPLQKPPPDAARPSVEVAAPALTPPDPTKPPNIRTFRDARGRFLVPASGQLVRSFGAADGMGLVSKGLTYQTRSGAQVVSPFDGRVLFAGPFRGYGEILIIEHGDGYHSLLSGLERLDVTVGQWLVAGEPVGAMPGSDDKPRLYLELRQDGQPINPLPWLATSNEKVSG